MDQTAQFILGYLCNKQGDWNIVNEESEFHWQRRNLTIISRSIRTFK